MTWSPPITRLSRDHRPCYDGWWSPHGEIVGDILGDDGLLLEPPVDDNHRRCHLMGEPGEPVVVGNDIDDPDL